MHFIGGLGVVTPEFVMKVVGSRGVSMRYYYIL